MDQKTRKEVSGLILETMLFEIIKDGRIEAFERQIMHKICTHLRISPEEFQVIKQRVQKQVQQPDSRAGAFDPELFFGKLRALLFNVLNAEETAFIIRKTASLLEVDEPEFEPSLLGGDILHNLKSPDVGIRTLAIQDLIASALPDNKNILTQALQNEKDVQLRYEIRKGLAELQSLAQKDKEEINENRSFTPADNDEELTGLLQSEELSVVRNACVQIVRNQKTALYREVLKQEERWNDAVIRGCALKILGQFGAKYADRIMKYADDEDPRVVSVCIEILEKTGDSASLAKIVSLAEHENNRVRADALKAMHNLGDETAAALLERMISSGNNAYRDSATYVLGQLKIPQAANLLGRLLTDEVESIRSKAYCALKEMANQDNTAAIKVLEEFEAKKTPEIPEPGKASRIILPLKSTAVSAATSTENETDTSTSAASEPKNCQNTDSSSAPENFPALVSQSPKIRIEAIDNLTVNSSPAYALAQIKERLLLENEPRVISAALRSLSNIEGHTMEKADILSNYLENSNDDRIRANALEGLASLRRQEDRPVFARLLKDRCNRVIGNAVIALYESDNNAFTKEITDTISYLAAHKNRDFQLTAISCSAQLQEEYCLDCLQALRKSNHLQSIREVIKSLSLYEKNREQALHMQQEFRTLLQERESGMSYAEILQSEPCDRTENIVTTKTPDTSPSPEPENNDRTEQDEIKKARPAGFWIRLTAFGVDSAIHGLAIIITLAFIYGLLEKFPASLTQIVNFIRALVTIVLLFCIPCLYYASLESGSEFETTIGKMLMGLKVLNRKNQQPSFWQSLARFTARLPFCLLFAIPALIVDDPQTQLGLYLLAYAGFLLPHIAVAGSKNQGLHDIISGCRVMKIKPPQFQPWFAFFIGWILTSLFHGIVFFMMVGSLHMSKENPGSSGEIERNPDQSISIDNNLRIDLPERCSINRDEDGDLNINCQNIPSNIIFLVQHDPEINGPEEYQAEIEAEFKKHQGITVLKRFVPIKLKSPEISETRLLSHIREVGQDKIRQDYIISFFQDKIYVCLISGLAQNEKKDWPPLQEICHSLKPHPQ
jgi:HEAT repeat protein/uncharacterized RDD family membrane protein YckC